ncbi:hypothetical protein B0H15DRAFT_812381 [Mycena belliarum]|uniref:Leucine-rich repeat-containing protein 40 n=1 Tax=Mycena belliarum TaxID=1033014 RepID=A0AAD6XW80_9AGAR|nr:hypothetical protein B0H15DRAFT_812381 [Mycena belliae]
MSRIPQPTRGTPRKVPPSLSPAPASRVRTKSTVARATTPSKPARKLYADTDSFLDKPLKPGQDSEGSESKPLSIKEAIALKRAAAKKAQTGAAPSPLDDISTLEDAIPNAPPPPEDDDPLGRPTLRETIERAKSTGSINLSTRSLQCIPSALFDIHLGITPEPLKSVPSEPSLPPAPETGRRKPTASPAWFEIQDLEVLKAWGNEIAEIQPEISLFGSLKSIDLHRNKIMSLPEQFTDLALLNTLDLSNNALETLPIHLFSLPALSNLNVADNALVSLPFAAPFSVKPSAFKTTSSSLFAPEIKRASTPLPKLAVFNASNNKLTASGIDLDVPKSIVTLDLSGNPLEAQGYEAVNKLLKVLATLEKLKVLRGEKTDISDRALEGVSLSSGSFPSMSVFDFGFTKITENGARDGFKGLAKELTFEVTNEDPPSGTTRVIVGKRVVREAWELEAERRSKSRAGKSTDPSLEWDPVSRAAPPKSRGPIPVIKAPVEKEAWEIEAEQGLLTEGGKRRARAAAAAAAGSGIGIGTPPRQASPTPKTFSLTDPQYYTSRTETLTLPASIAAKKIASGHSRTFSLGPTSLMKPPNSTSDVMLPTSTMPLSLIAAQPFSQTLKILVLTNRRMDRSFTLPGLPALNPLLPRLEELSLEGCSLGDSVSIATASAEEILVVPSDMRPTLPLIAELFPSLRNLNMAYNTLTSAALTASVLSSMIFSSASADSAPSGGHERKGLRQLNLRGNRITNLDGFQEIALLFKGHRDVPGWGLEELDVRDNEIGKLPSELGLLPLEVLMVDGNVFRVPARRVWEREGTKGLLSWLRGRIE